LRKTALYVQTKHKLFFEVESFTDPVKSGIMISDKTLVEYAKKNNLSNNDILSGLRTKEVLIQFQDEFIKWVYYQKGVSCKDSTGRTFWFQEKWIDSCPYQTNLSKSNITTNV
jgi:hypothetical protein